MGAILKFEDLECWKHARKLTSQIYRATKGDSFRQDINLSKQMQKASISVMSNIAEGFIRRSNREFIQFLFISMSSVAEIQSQLYIALDQGYIDKDVFCDLYERTTKTARLISGLLKYLRGKNQDSMKFHSNNITEKTE